MKIICDYCLDDINDSEYDEKPAITLEVGYEKYYFCCEDCYDKFLKGNTKEVYIYPNGEIEED